MARCAARGGGGAAAALRRALRSPEGLSRSRAAAEGGRATTLRACALRALLLRAALRRRCGSGYYADDADTRMRDASPARRRRRSPSRSRSPMKDASPRRARSASPSKSRSPPRRARSGSRSSPETESMHISSDDAAFVLGKVRVTHHAPRARADSARPGPPTRTGGAPAPAARRGRRMPLQP
jgi:hypothetical protein